MEKKRMAARRRKMLEMRKNLVSYRAIGLKFGISGERVRQLVNDTKPERRVTVDSPSLSTRDVARLLGIHANTVRRWANNGTLKSYRIGARQDRRFRWEDVERATR